MPAFEIAESVRHSGTPDGSNEVMTQLGCGKVVRSALRSVFSAPDAES